MTDSTKITSTIWTDRVATNTRSAGPAVQAVRVYLMTSPHKNSLGIYRLPVAYACADLGMTNEVFSKAMTTLQTAGFVKVDEKSEVVWVVEFAAEQIGRLNYSKKPSSLGYPDKRIYSARSDFERVPECALKGEFLAKYDDMLKLNNAPQPQAPEIAVTSN